MKSSRIALYAAMFLTLGSSAALAQQGGGMGGGRGQMMQQMMFKGITLTSAQQTQVDAITAKYDSLRRDMVEKSNGDREAMRGPMRDMIQKEGAELRAVLTADQAKIFDQNVAEMRERMQNRGGGAGSGSSNGGGGSPPPTV